MAGKPIDMSKLRKTLKLHVQGKSKYLSVITLIYLEIQLGSTCVFLSF